MGTLVYVAGTGRSGSTAFADHLATFTGYFNAGEVRYIWTRGFVEDHLCQCGEPFSGCWFWKAVMRTAYGDQVHEARSAQARLVGEIDRIRRIPYLRRAAMGRLGATDVLCEYAEVLAPLYAAIGEISGARGVIDGSKDPSYLFVLRACVDSDLAVVHLVRDARAVAYSWTRARRRPEIHWRTEYMRTLPPVRSAALWVEYNAACDWYRRTFGRTVRVRYEDFCEQGPDSLREVCAALDLPTAADLAGPVDPDDGHGAGPGDLAARQGHSFSGNPVRFSSSADRATLRVDNEWESALPRSQRVRVTAIGYPLLKAYRYR